MRSARLPVLVSVLVAAAAAAVLAQGPPSPPVVTPVIGATAVPAGTSVRAALVVQLPDGFHVQSNTPSDPGLIATEVHVDAPEGITVDEVVFPPALDFDQEGASEPLKVFEQQFAVGVQLTVAGQAPAGPLTVPVRLRYQMCDNKLCYAPKTARAEWTVPVVAAGAAAVPLSDGVLDSVAWGTGEAPGAAAEAAPAAASTPADAGDGLAMLDRFTTLGSAGGYLGADDFLTFISNAENGVTEPGLFEGSGPLAILLIVLIGGLALNLTPCVLPMIPINLAIIGAGAQAGSRRRGLLLGGTYGAAMAIVYGVLGLVVIMTAGTFGTINASPWFNVGIAVLFVVLGLAMFDVITIDFSSWSSNFNPGAGRGTFFLAFTMGAVAALLAGACVAPVVIQVVLFSSDLYAKGSGVALALPFVLGVGMALPWPFAGAGMASLPKPGPWMVRVKQAFGVLILGTALYYGYIAYGIFANRWVDEGAVASSVEEMLKEGWHASLAEGLQAAEREGKPVLIDMWATWCKNCLTMDETTLKNEQVRAALDGYVKIKFQAEQPDEEPARSIMQRFGAVGLPAYVIIRPAGGGN
ncbi:MAG: thioredoxin family protein [Vicinamibacterales bacterium]